MTMNHTLTYLVCRARAFTAALAPASLLVTIAASAATCPAGLAAVNPTPTSDFLINGNGTVTHTATGLMWKQCNEGLTGNACATGSASVLLWADALTAAKKQRLCWLR